MIRVAIAEPHATVRTNLEQLCCDSYNVTVAGSASDPKELLSRVPAVRPDVIVMTLSAQPAVTFDAVRELKRQHSGTPVILLSLYHHDSYALCALEAGASGYLMLEQAQEYLIDTIRMFVLGGPMAPGPHGQFAAI